MTEHLSTSIDLHTLLDDGEPHCSCGESFRGRPHHEYVLHALTELRSMAKRVSALQDVADRAQEFLEWGYQDDRYDSMNRLEEALDGVITSANPQVEANEGEGNEHMES